MEIRSRYNAGAREGWKSSVPSMTQQQFKDEADINYIVSMYDSSGVMPTFHGDGQPRRRVHVFSVMSLDLCQRYAKMLLRCAAYHEKK